MKKPIFNKPSVGGSVDVWGNELNAIIDQQNEFNQQVIDETSNTNETLASLEENKLNKSDLNPFVADTVDNYIDTVTKLDLQSYVDNTLEPSLDLYTTSKKDEISRYVETTSKPSLNTHVENVNKVSLNSYTENTLKPSLNTHVENVNKPSLNNYVENTSKTDINTYVETKKDELDTYVNTVSKPELKTYGEEQIDLYINNTTKPSIDSYVENTSKVELNSFVESEKIELNNYNNSKKLELDNYKDEKIEEMAESLDLQGKLNRGTYSGTASDLKSEIDNNKTYIDDTVVPDLQNDIATKLTQGSLPSTITDAKKILDSVENTIGMPLDPNNLYVESVGNKLPQYVYMSSNPLIKGFFTPKEATSSIELDYDIWNVLSVKNNAEDILLIKESLRGKYLIELVTLTKSTLLDISKNGYIYQEKYKDYDGFTMYTGTVDGVITRTVGEWDRTPRWKTVFLEGQITDVSTGNTYGVASNVLNNDKENSRIILNGWSSGLDYSSSEIQVMFYKIIGL